MVPVIVPAAPCDWPGLAVTLVQGGGGGAPGVVVVEGGAEVEVVDDEVVTDWWCDVVVVVVVAGVFELLQAATKRATPASAASAHRDRFTPRSPPGARSPGTGGTGPPARRGCPLRRPLPRA